MVLASFAMVVAPEHMEVDGVSLARIFNKDLFQSQESRVHFSSTQVANETAEVDVDLGSMGIKASLPVLDRHSHLSYAIAQHVHWTLAPHRGVETCNRVSLENVHIIKGVGLYREIIENCPSCAIKRKKYLEAAFGPIRDIHRWIYSDL